jgi:hypothetical protein
MQIDPSRRADAARNHQIQQDMLARLRGRPDVAAASLATIMPFAEFGRSERALPGAPLTVGDPVLKKLIRSTFNAVGSQYFDTLSLRVLAGREFTPDEERNDGTTDHDRRAVADEAVPER